MRSRPDPKPAPRKLPEAKLRHDPQVIKWVQRLKGDPAARPTALSETELRWVMEEVMRRRGDEFSDTHFAKAMEKTTPVLAHPQVTDAIEDLGHIFSQPEMGEFWKVWTTGRPKAGPTPNLEFAKAMLATMAVPGITSRGDDAHRLLHDTPRLQDVFEMLSAKAGQAFGPMGYSGAMRLIHKAAGPCHQLALYTNIEMLKELRALGFDQIGKRLLIDGSAVPAWAQQVSAGRLPKNPTPKQQEAHDRREAELRKRAEEAGFRMLGYTRNGKIVPADEKVGSGLRAGKIKAWRGYYLVVIADQATGLPLVWSLVDAREDEARQIIPLLSQLFSLWPELHDDRITEMIAGDSAWDEDPWCRLCEVDYGIAPIFRLHDDRGLHMVKPGQTRGTRVAGFTHRGELICSSHLEPCDMIKFEPHKRDSTLRAGQTEAADFRVRALCTHHGGAVGGGKPCGHLSLKADTDWSKLTRYPHHASGRPELYAMRQAMLVRLGQIESLWNVLKTGNMLAGSGPTRTKMCNRTTHEALISLAFLGTTAITLADQRQRHGIAVPPLAGVAAAPSPATTTPNAAGTPAPPSGVPPVVAPAGLATPTSPATSATRPNAAPDPARQALATRRTSTADGPAWVRQPAQAWHQTERTAA